MRQYLHLNQRPSIPQNGGRGDSGEIILINGDVPRIIVIAPEAILVEIELG
jgi:hypothetical protein